MRNALRQIIVLVACVATIGAAPIAAASASSQTPSDQTVREAKSVSGELLRVDPDAKTLAIKAADNTEIQFRYTDATEITGAEKGAAGLATMGGAQVTVQYNMEGTSRTATRIDVHAR